ncbi:uncharacterized protein A4U43_C05F7700 [Asparagus officinalis]|uniref:Uncharacterized protein n=1 Tax=Asparagus officinalis TaxID=4686 RepID=A0A5P1EQ29_ASPOF|nr:uncharacterized protein A4U43_C05F7700 [Asparagus officinalis]
MDKSKASSKASEHDKSGESNRHSSLAVSSCAEGSHRMKDTYNCQTPNLENTSKAKAKRLHRRSEHGKSGGRLSPSASTFPSAAESKLLNEKDDGRPQIRNAPKNLMATRKRQRDDVEALLSSALISSKKSEGSSRAGSTKTSSCK